MTLDLTATQLTEPGDGLPLLVVGPSIGTSVTALWSSCAARLAGTIPRRRLGPARARPQRDHP